MDQKLIATLEHTGAFTRDQAAVLDYLLNRQSWPVTAREIERDVDLRQPVVNPIVRDFVGRRWLEESKLIEKRKGRRTYLYRMNIDRQGILRYIENTIKAKVDQINNVLTDEARAIILGADNK